MIDRGSPPLPGLLRQEWTVSVHPTCIRRPGLVFAGVVMLAGASGCRPDAGCTDIGAESGVSFFFMNVLVQHPHQVLSVRACVRSTCTLGWVPKERAAGSTRVVDDALSDATAVPVTLTIRDNHDHVIFEGATTVALHKFQPNGPKCGPTVWQAGVMTHGDSHFTEPR
jgi:hypothetical protein